MTADQWLADIRVRDASWTANYAHMHRSDGYGQAAYDRRSLLAEVERLRTSNANLLTALYAKQAKIDALMLEFCPGEMSAEQRDEWAKHQRRAADVSVTTTENT